MNNKIITILIIASISYGIYLHAQEKKVEKKSSLIQQNQANTTELSFPQDYELSPVIFKVGTTEITKWDFDNLAKLMRKPDDMQLSENKKKSYKAKMTKELIYIALLCHEARNRGYKSNFSLSSLIKSMGGETNFYKFLKQNKITAKQAHQKMINSYLIKRMQEDLKSISPNARTEMMQRLQRENPIVFIDKSYDPRKSS